MSRTIMLLLVAVAACADLPASPTYLDDVRPLLIANCVRCHAAPRACTPYERASFRLDTWSSVGEIRGVAAMSEAIIVQAADQGTMPLGNPLTEREREILRRWRRAGSPFGERVVNHAPWLTVLSAIPATEPADQLVDIEYLVGDGDGDTVTWDLGWTREGVEGWLLRSLGAGRGRATLDLGALPTGTYELVARMADGVSEPVTLPIGAPIEVPERNAAPSVRLLSPNDGVGLARDQVVEIAWTADDADSPGTLTAELTLVDSDGNEQAIASGLDARRGSFEWMPATIGDGLSIEVRVSDGTSERLDRSDCSFAISEPP